MSLTAPPPSPAPTSATSADKTAATIAAIAVLLMDDEDGARLTPRVAGLLAWMRLSRQAIIEAVRIATIRPVTTLPETSRRATAATREAEFYYRATYIVQAATRIHNAVRTGKALSAAVQGERSIYQRHLDAQGKRATQAAKINRIAMKQGTTLGWYAVMDERTSTECRQANGKNFQVDERPLIGYPGTVHPSCRCTAGPPHPTKQTVYPIRYGTKARRSA